MFGNLGAGEIILIILVILLLFGAKKIPELAQGLGKGMKEFKKAVRDVEDEIKKTDEEVKQEEKKS
ncbi:MAG: twin-arginine translocase TatA/TatE family subunit [Ignavibacterium sp.]|jgi:sec-independent protein translocase protein TatA|uniref:twin-arginine translocase TatA/TatE family subunit n=1 Tax=Ignavibacterium sp. TaxID=2651167 RepID=UPI003297CE15